MSLIGLLASTEKMVPEGVSHEALSVSPQGALEISSVAGQPPSTKKKVTHKCSRVEGVFPGPSKFQGPVSNQTVLVATDNSTVVPT